LNLDGTIACARPIQDLATVFDMCGLSSEASSADRLTVTGQSVALYVVRDDAHSCSIRGTLARDVEQAAALATQIALALEADGIAFSLGLYDLDGTKLRHLTPIG
jgi:hypothetical protein